MARGTVPLMPATVAILGTRYPDFAIEADVLGPGVEIVSGPGGSVEEILACAGGAEVILAGSLPRFSAEVIARLPECRAIVRSGIGVDSIDLDAAGAADIWVVNVPDYGTEAVAQHTLAMALASMRRLPAADRLVKDGGWGLTDLRPLHLPAAMTAGVLGYGRIGRRVAELFVAVGFGAVIAHDPVSPPVGADPVRAATIEEVISTSHVLSLHAPPAPGGEPLIGADQLATMQPDAVLVNTARGDLVDIAVLADGLRSGRPGFVALDVFRPEPPDLSALRGFESQVLLSPHMAWYTEESQADLRRKSAQEAARILTGQPPINPVVRPKGST